MGHVVQLLSQFADDLDLYMEFNQQSWQAVMNTLTSFEQISGMKVNYDKTTVYRLGSIRNTDAKFYSEKKVKWTNEPVNILGCWVTHDKEENMRLNLDPIFQKAENILNLWYHRNLSLFGKILVINSLVTSLFTYRLVVVEEIPERYQKQYRKLVTKFLWTGGTPKIEWRILVGQRSEGGAGLICLKRKEKALKMSFIMKANKNPELQVLADNALDSIIGNSIWKCHITRKDIISKFPIDNYWRQVLIMWSQTFYREPHTLTDVSKQVIWYNSSIKIRDEVVAFTNFIQSGIIYLQDLLDERGEFLSNTEIQHKLIKSKPFTRYLGLLKAIPLEWKKILKSKVTEDNINNFIDSHTSSKVSALLYKELSNTGDLLYKVRNKWQKKGINFEEEEFLRAF